MMESYQSNHIQNPQVLQQKRSDDALSIGSDSAYSTDSGGEFILNTYVNLLQTLYLSFVYRNKYFRRLSCIVILQEKHIGMYLFCYEPN